MCKQSRAVGLALAIVALAAVGASAQNPFFAVYFDPSFAIRETNCPGPGPGILYVAGVGFNSLVTGAEFAVWLPPAVTWVADINKPAVTIGTTPTGIAMGYTTPLNGYSTVELCRVEILWACASCASPYLDNEIVVIPSPRTGFLGWTDTSFTERPAAGLVSLVCPAGVAIELTTWGRVKALFSPAVEGGEAHD
jgi:hypothetical protein